MCAALLLVTQKGVEGCQRTIRPLSGSDGQGVTSRIGCAAATAYYSLSPKSTAGRNLFWAAISAGGVLSIHVDEKRGALVCT